MSQAPTQMNQRMSQQAIPDTAEERRSYLAEGHSLRSWLLTTDHKRIAILFLIAITFFFLCGGIAAALIRFELLTPTPDLLSNDGYNRTFSLHGIIMVWFFLIPSIPTTFGNFLVPMMIGARDLAFPRLNLLSWYIFVLGGLFTLVTVVAGGVDTGWTFYTPFSSTYSNSGRDFEAQAQAVADRARRRGAAVARAGAAGVRREPSAAARRAGDEAYPEGAAGRVPRRPGLQDPPCPADGRHPDADRGDSPQ